MKKLNMILSCKDITHTEIIKLVNEPSVISLYYACGTNSLLIEFEGSLEERANVEQRVSSLSVGKSSIVIEKYKIKKSKKIHSSNIFNYITNYIFLKSKEPDFNYPKFIESLYGDLGTKNIIIEALYKTVGNDGFNHIMKILVNSISTLNSVIELCQNQKTHTITKLVLQTYKNNGKILLNEWDDFIDKFNKARELNIDYIVASALHNNTSHIFNPPMLFKNHNTLNTYVKELIPDIIDCNLGKVRVQNRLLLYDVEKYKENINKDSLQHPNEIIDRYAIKLDANNWQKLLLFVKAELGVKDKLQNKIQKKILGVEKRWFARKFYHITGDFDFVVPIDVNSLGAVTQINKELDKMKHKDVYLVKNRHTVFCKGTRSDGEFSGNVLNLDEIAIIKSLLINSTDLYFYKKQLDIVLGELADQLINYEDGEIASDYEIIDKFKRKPQLPDLSPRQEYFCKELIDYFNKRQILHDDITLKSIDEIGIVPSVEFDDKKEIMKVLVRCRFKDAYQKSEFRESISDKLRKQTIIENKYESARDDLLCYYIWKIPSLIHLHYLVTSIKEKSLYFEFCIIFRQNFYSKNLQEKIRCRPCFYPADKENKCSSCVRYITPKIRDQFLEIDFKVNRHNIKNNIISLAAVGMNIDEKKYLKIIIPDSPESIEHGKAIKKALLDQVSNNMNVVVFPEYSVPLHLYSELKKMILNSQIGSFKNGLIILGSHCDSDGYNCSPIFIINNGEVEIRHIYKNKLSPYENIPGVATKTGQGHLKFINSPIGNFLTLICFDVHKEKGEKIFDDIDFLFVPSFNSKRSFLKRIEQFERFKVPIVYSNTYNDSGASTRIITSDKLEKGTKNFVKSYHQKKFQISTLKTSLKTIKKDKEETRLH